MADLQRRKSLSGRSPILLAAVALTMGCRVEDVRQPSVSVERHAGMAYVPPGQCVIGSAETGSLQRVALKGFHIDRFEVTNEQYLTFVNATGHALPEPADGGPLRDPELAKHPVVNVTYTDAVTYAKWAGKRLATEEEWERAARGVDGRAYPWGSGFDRTKCNVSGKGTAPVGSFPDDLSPAGCYDMAGNVSEWTASRCDRGMSGTAAATEASAPMFRVIRGGAWDYRVASTKAYGRRRALPDVRSEFVGFRCARVE